MFESNSLEIISNFLDSDECNQKFTIESFLGVMVAIVCCPKEIESETFCELVVGNIHQDWLTKTPLRLARMQVNDAISEAFLANNFAFANQFKKITGRDSQTSIVQWCRGFMIASSRLDSLWQQDLDLLSDKISQKEVEKIQLIRADCFALAEKIDSDNAELASKQHDILNLDGTLQKLHDAAIYIESLKIRYKIA